jgi:nickel-dependent lactate racemase
VPDPEAALRAALAAPIASRRLRDLVKRGQAVAIVVCDITRAQPRQLMLEALFEELDGIVRPADIVILIATGTHRANTPGEIQEMLGPEIASACRVVNHDARDRSSLADLGILGDGVPVFLSREWIEADFRITTGFVEPHLFAGFSGGPKLVAPGLAGIETVLTLHDFRRVAHPDAIWGVTEGNPIHDDVRAIARATGVDFAMDVVLNRRQEITGVFAGELFEMHRAACAVARRDAMQAVERPFDVVVTTNSGYPLDQNLYQSVKGMSAAARIVRPGGLIVCATECRDGIPDHGSYTELLASRSSPEALLEMIAAPGHSVPDQWEVQVQAQIQRHARVVVKAGCLTDAQLTGAHLEPIDDVALAVAGAGADATVCVLPEGPQTIPYLA